MEQQMLDKQNKKELGYQYFSEKNMSRLTLFLWNLR